MMHGQQNIKLGKPVAISLRFTVLHFYVRIKIRVATLSTNRSVTNMTQSIAASDQKLPDSAVKSTSTFRHRQSMCQAKRSAYRSAGG
jgi:hypothetical protein